MGKANQDQPASPLYRSGAVGRLTGIPVETLRVWERRYGVVGPRQSPSGRRQYAPHDVTRLTIIKRLVDAGYAIGSIAALDLEQLRLMLRQVTHPPRETLAAAAKIAAATQHIAIVGEALAIRMRHGLPEDLQVAAVSASAARAFDDFRGVRADALLIEFPSVQRNAPQLIRSLAQLLGAQQIIVEYGFASRELEQDLRALGCHLVRAPLNVNDLESLCRAAPAAAFTGQTANPAHDNLPPPRRFDSKTLARIATRSTALNCECPRHIADLLVALGNFETYSGECEGRNPDDAALHRYLKQVTGNARAMMEMALQRVVEAEDMAVNDD